MKVRYDRVADAAYIQIAERDEYRQVGATVMLDPVEVGGIVGVDLDEDGRIVGLEVMDARSMLTPSVLAQARGYGE